MLKASIPGCESLEKLSDTDMKATAAVKIGPISARFSGAVHLSDIDPPNGYTIGGEGQGGVAGFAKGGAKVRLEDDGTGTLLQLRGARPGRRQDRPAWRAADRRQRQADGRCVLRPVQPRRSQPPPAPARRRRTARRHRGRAGSTAATVPPSAISPFALVPREPFGLPLVAWIGGAIYLFMLLLILGSML